MGYSGRMAEVYEILAGVVAILEEMEEERHDARYFVLMAALEKALEMVDGMAE